MKQRILTALAVLGVGLPLLWYGQQPFALFILTLVVIAFLEIMMMAHIHLFSYEAIIGTIMTIGLVLPNSVYQLVKLTPLLLLTVGTFLLLICTVFSKNEFSFEKVGVVCLGALYVGLGGHYILEIRQQGFLTMLFVLAIGWMTDTGAYFVGSKFGKTKLAAHISPNKSIEGAVGGTIIALIFASIYYYFYPVFDLTYIQVLLLTVVVSISCQMGDLVESALKRFYHVKDSGDILPGHGGVLDRFDSALFGVVACYIFVTLLH